MNVFWIGLAVVAFSVLVRGISYMRRYSKDMWKADREARKWARKTLREMKKK